jgi:hypothetical protein
MARRQDMVATVVDPARPRNVGLAPGGSGV